jgi:small subunit ribosomal protein S18
MNDDKRSGGPGKGRGAGSRGGNGRNAGNDKSGGPRRSMFRRRKVCKFCTDKVDYIDYKDVRLLAPFVPERAKILPRRISGVCAMHQRKLQTAIKRARQLALVPYLTD